MERRVFHVMPGPKGWELIGEQTESSRTTHPDIQQAVMAARAIIRTAGSGQIVIHNPDGSVEEEFS